MNEALQPPVARPRLSKELRAQVLELRRTHSAADVARQTGVPVGTIKAMASRAGSTRDNMVARAFFALPPLVQSASTSIAVPTPLPTQKPVTGDRDLDAMLWLREVVDTGDADLIETAMEAAKCIKTPAKEIELRYAHYLAQAHGSAMMAALGSMDFADLTRYASRVMDRQTCQREAVARLGSKSAVFTDQATELFCINALAKVKLLDKQWIEYDNAAACTAFEAHVAMRPHTLGDCLHEHAYWVALYQLRRAWPNSGDDLPQVSARRSYLDQCMSRLRPKDRSEAMAVLRYLADDGMYIQDMEHGEDILKNLIG
jgi:hypothetical protein